MKYSPKIVNHFYTKYKVGYIFLFLDIDQLKLYTNFVSQTMLDWQSWDAIFFSQKRMDVFYLKALLSSATFSNIASPLSF